MTPGTPPCVLPPAEKRHTASRHEGKQSCSSYSSQGTKTTLQWISVAIQGMPPPQFTAQELSNLLLLKLPDAAQSHSMSVSSWHLLCCFQLCCFCRARQGSLWSFQDAWEAQYSKSIRDRPTTGKHRRAGSL